MSKSKIECAVCHHEQEFNPQTVVIVDDDENEIRFIDDVSKSNAAIYDDGNGYSLQVTIVNEYENECSAFFDIAFCPKCGREL